MSAPIQYGFVSLPAPVAGGPLADVLNRGGDVTTPRPGWFCWGCRNVAPESVGVMVFARDHAQCRKALAAVGEEKT